MVQQDIEAVFAECISKGGVLKVIVETALLSQEEKRKVYHICSEIGVHYIKTSTGFSTNGATIEDVEFIRSLVPDTMKIKASGGIKTSNFARELIAAGANRLGCSSSVAIVNS